MLIFIVCVFTVLYLTTLLCGPYAVPLVSKIRVRTICKSANTICKSARTFRKTARTICKSARTIVKVHAQL